MTSALDALPPIGQMLKNHGLSANKKLGQHFLLDMNITDKIASMARPIGGAFIIEIGPGPGGLTRSLLCAGASQGGGAKRVLAVEMDERFLPLLEQIGAASSGRLEVLRADATQTDLATLASGPAPVKIVANLPYNVGTKLLTDWLTASPLFWDQAVLMFQKEVAERIVAAPGDKAFGRLAVLAQSVAKCYYAFDVPARAFTPPPKVDSAVIILEPLAKDQRFSDLDSLSKLTQAAFSQRRKMLRRSLKPISVSYGLNLENWLEDAGVDGRERPENLPVATFQTLACGLIKRPD